MGSSLARSPDGISYLSWLEPAGNGAWLLKFSRFDSAGQQWGEARNIARGSDWFINWADFPVLAAEAGRLTAVWFVDQPATDSGAHGEAYRAVFSISSDEGRTWTEPHPITGESASVEFVALQRLPDGRMLAAWLDGRGRSVGNERQALYARVLGEPGSDALVDPSVCDCCQLSLAVAPDGGVLLAYRGRTKDEIRDMQVARFDGHTWSQPTPLNADGWKIAGCPVNGPQLATSGRFAGAVWFTAPNQEPQVLARVSTDAGRTFGPVRRIDLGRPQGRVDAAMFADGTFALTWLEGTGQPRSSAGGVYLRSLSAEGELSDAAMLAPMSANRVSGFPRIIRSGQRQITLTLTQDALPSRIRTFQVDLP